MSHVFVQCVLNKNVIVKRKLIVTYQSLVFAMLDGNGLSIRLTPMYSIDGTLHGQNTHCIYGKI